MRMGLKVVIPALNGRKPTCGGIVHGHCSSGTHDPEPQLKLPRAGNQTRCTRITAFCSNPD
jgi:hypothetical protein